MQVQDIPGLQAGQKLFVRRRWEDDKVNYVYDADVIANDIDGAKVDIIIHYPGNTDKLTLFYSGRTLNGEYLVTDFFLRTPRVEQIGCYSYAPARDLLRTG